MSARPARWSPDAAAAALLAAPAAAFGLLWAAGRTFYWGDLTYIHHPWRAVAADQVQRGILPLWNPYVYLGMPLAGQMQSAVWYPGTLPFHLFSFETGLAFFHALHYALAGLFAFLWLRREGLSRTAAIGGAMAYALSGGLVSRVPFLNHLSSLAFVPAFLLLRDRPGLLGLSFALCFLGGYPPILAGGAAGALALCRLVGAGRAQARTWAAAGLMAAGLGAVMLPAAVELALSSRRGGGLGSEETLTFGMSPADWGHWVSPLLAGGESSAALFWWKTCYLGFAAWIALALALPRLRARAAAGLGVYLSGVLLLCLGGSNPVSGWLWAHLAPLRYVRYPGNMAYFALPAAALLVAAGLEGRRGGRWLVAAIAVELGLCAAFAHPTVERGYFTDAGPLVRSLREGLRGHRYLLSPVALEWPGGYGPDAESRALDLKHRLYGLTNAPYHLRSIGNFGEPLVPRACYDYMDFLYRLPSAAAAAGHLRWADAVVLMTRDPVARVPAGFMRGPATLWPSLRTVGEPAEALWLDAESAAEVPNNLPEGPPPRERGRRLEVARQREDRFSVRGEAREAGWVYVAEPRLPGWGAWLGGRPAETSSALGAFTKLRVPAGAWEIRFLYDPGSFRYGLWGTLASLMLLAAYWYNRLTPGTCFDSFR